MVFRIKTGKSFPALNDEDYLGIMALALSSLAESFVKSTNSTVDVKHILMVYVTESCINWQNDKEKIKNPLLTEVKSSINKSVEWLQINQQKKPTIKRWEKEINEMS